MSMSMMKRTGWTAIASIGALALLAQARVVSAEGTPHNGLSSEAFRANALTTNSHALDLLVHHALDPQLFAADGGYIGRQLADPHARAVLTEIISCALDRSTTIGFTGASGQAFSWTGELGLCPSWSTGAPAAACQELVTACVTSRVNALHRSIPISLHSEAAPLSAGRTQVPSETRFRESPSGEDPAAGIPIRSFDASCASGDCGWQAGSVGACQPGQQVELAIDGAACSAATLRVCGGIHGCFPAGSGQQLPPGFPVPPQSIYDKYGIDKHGPCASTPLSFTCPSALAIRGYYSVMVKPGEQPADKASLDVVKLSAGGQYPAPDSTVFSLLEGAFYGNLFRPDRLRRSCELDAAGSKVHCTSVPGVTPPSEPCDIDIDPTTLATGAATGTTNACLDSDPSLPYVDVYACYSYAQQVETADDDLNAAAFNSRICDQPDAHARCFPHKIERCHYASAQVNDAKGAGCKAIGSDGAYGDCPGKDGDATTYQRIITTYLNDACDLTGDTATCDGLRRTIEATPSSTTGVPKVGAGPRGCGCAAGSSGSEGGEAAAPAALAAIVLLVLRGLFRRRSPLGLLGRREQLRRRRQPCRRGA